MNFLKKKLGPLPAWGWGLMLVGLLVLYIWYRKRQSSAAASAANSALTTTPSSASANPSGALSCTSGVATCPSGYMDDGTGNCNCVPISSSGSGGGGSAPSTVPTSSAGTCPPGYQLDPTGTFCQIIESTTTTSSGGCATGYALDAATQSCQLVMPAGGCPSGMTADPTGAFCLTSATPTPTPTTTTSTYTGPDYTNLQTTAPGASLPPGAIPAPDASGNCPAGYTSIGGDPQRGRYCNPIAGYTAPAAATGGGTTTSAAGGGGTPAAAPSAQSQAAAEGLCVIDSAEATLAFKKGLSVWYWDGSKFSGGTKGPAVPNGGNNLYGNCSSLDSNSIPHAGH